MLGGSLIKIPPTNQTVMEGQTAFFPCVMKYPDTSAASWLKDGTLLQDIPELMQRAFMGPEGSLSIDPTIMSDSGEYECRVQNNDSEVQTSKAFLNVQCKLNNIHLISSSPYNSRIEFDLIENLLYPIQCYRQSESNLCTT